VDVSRKLYGGYDTMQLLDHTLTLLREMPSLYSVICHRWVDNLEFHVEKEHVIIDFDFDFEAHVERHLSFAAKLERYSWDRLAGRLGNRDRHYQRIVRRYSRFMALKSVWPRLREDPKCSFGELIPTLDIDFAWRTHILSPERYHAYCVILTGERIPHATSMVGPGWCRDRHRTSLIYEQVFKQSFDLCFCWNCFARRDADFLAEPAKAVIDLELEKERIRRLSLGLEESLDLAEKQCRKCGSHPHRDCNPKHFFKPEHRYNGNYYI
jgi:hypothetical protein